MSTFLAAMWPAFFIRVRPASRNAKPACMNITSTAVTTTQIVLAATRSSVLLAAKTRLGIGVDLLQLPSGPVVDDVPDVRLPDEPVARLVAAPGRIRDRERDLVRDLVADEERQVRLRQEAGLEHPTAVLVGDPALPSMTDRLDHRHADVPGGVLDGVDHGLD